MTFKKILNQALLNYSIVGMYFFYGTTNRIAKIIGVEEDIKVTSENHLNDAEASVVVKIEVYERKRIKQKTAELTIDNYTTLYTRPELEAHLKEIDLLQITGLEILN